MDGRRVLSTDDAERDSSSSSSSSRRQQQQAAAAAGSRQQQDAAAHLVARVQESEAGVVAGTAQLVANLSLLHRVINGNAGVAAKPGLPVHRIMIHEQTHLVCGVVYRIVIPQAATPDLHMAMSINTTSPHRAKEGRSESDTQPSCSELHQA